MAANKKFYFSDFDGILFMQYRLGLKFILVTFVFKLAAMLAAILTNCSQKLLQYIGYKGLQNTYSHTAFHGLLRVH